MEKDEIFIPRCPRCGEEWVWPPDQFEILQRNDKSYMRFTCEDCGKNFDVSVDTGFMGPEISVVIKDEAFLNVLAGKSDLLTYYELNKLLDKEEEETDDSVLEKFYTTWRKLIASVFLVEVDDTLYLHGYDSFSVDHSPLIRRCIENELARQGQLALATSNSRLLDELTDPDEMSDLINRLNDVLYGQG